MCPVPLSVIWKTEGGSALESALHRRFRAQRSHGEWFDFEGEDAKVEVEAAIAAMSAEAFETNAEAEVAYGAALVDLDAATDRVKEARNVLALAEGEAREAIATALRTCVAAGRTRTEVQRHAPFSAPVVREIGEKAGVPADERYIRTRENGAG